MPYFVTRYVKDTGKVIVEQRLINTKKKGNEALGCLEEECWNAGKDHKEGIKIRACLVY